MTKNILVTGGAGYIGSHVCKALFQAGFKPIVYDNLCTGNKEAVKWGPFEEGDILDVGRLDEVIHKYSPIAIMHFAALIQVAESVSAPDKYYYNNVYGSFLLLEQARKNDIKYMVLSSTAAVYGVPQNDLIAEDHPLSPINPYGATKLSMENMIRDYSGAYGLNYATLRYFNAAGADPDGELGTAYPKDTHIIPLLMQTATGERSQIDVFGTDYQTPDGTAVRDYIHVTDLAQAHVLSLKHILDGKSSLTLNLGTSSGCSVNTVLKTARQVTLCPIPSEDKPRRAGDPDILVANANAAKEILNWTPELSNLNDIIKTAWNWQNRKKKLGKAGAFTKTTI